MSFLNQDLIYSKNNIITKNVSKIKKKILVIKSGLVEDEEDNYDQIYCKINIYFTALINKIRLKYIQALEHYKAKIKQYENDILKLIMENMLLKIENNLLLEKDEYINKKILNNKNIILNNNNLNYYNKNKKNKNNIYIMKKLFIKVKKI